MLKQVVNKVTIVPLKGNVHSIPYRAFLRDNSLRRPLDDNVRVPENSSLFDIEWIRKAVNITCVNSLKFSGLLNHTPK